MMFYSINVIFDCPHKINNESVKSAIKLQSLLHPNVVSTGDNFLESATSQHRHVDDCLPLKKIFVTMCLIVLQIAFPHDCFVR